MYFTTFVQIIVTSYSFKLKKIKRLSVYFKFKYTYLKFKKITTIKISTIVESFKQYIEILNLNRKQEKYIIIVISLLRTLLSYFWFESSVNDKSEFLPK